MASVFDMSNILVYYSMDSRTIKSEKPMKKILFFLKDISGGQWAVLLYKALVEQGHQVLVAVEQGGKAAKPLEEANIPFCYPGGLNWVESILDDGVTDVYVGYSSPMTSEQDVVRIAGEKGIPVIGISDTWNSHTRLRPDLRDHITTVLCVDNVDVEYVEQAYGPGIAKVIGSPFNQGSSTALESNHLAEVSNLDKVTLLVAGQMLQVGDGESAQYPTAAILDKLAEYIAADPSTQYDIIDKVLHPKFGAETPGYTQTISALERLGALNNVTLIDPKSLDGNLITQSDALISIYSGMLQGAARSGVFAISFTTDAGTAAMKDETGLRTYPLVSAGACHEVSDIDSWKQLFDSSYVAGVLAKAKEYYAATTWTPEVL